MATAVIYKTGYSETLAEEKSGNIVSLGDVVRTTPLVSLLKRKNFSSIYWITSKECVSLLQGIEGLTQVLTTSNLPHHLLEKTDLFINLEKDLEESISLEEGTKLYGFSPLDDSKVHTSEGIDSLLNFKMKLKLQNKPTLQDFIFTLLGEDFSGEKYLIPESLFHETEDTFVVGLNWKVGKKWPTKQVSLKVWESIDLKLRDSNISTTWQEGFSDIGQYCSWINSSQILITNDSLGMHLALGLGKKVFCFFGPTSIDEIYDYKLLVPYRFKVPINYECLPCYSSLCHMPQQCSSYIDEDEVVRKITQISKNL